MGHWLHLTSHIVDYMNTDMMQTTPPPPPLASCNRTANVTCPLMVDGPPVWRCTRSMLLQPCAVVWYVCGCGCPPSSHQGRSSSSPPTEYICHVHVRSDGLSCVVISDQEYPSRVCYTLMTKIMDQFEIDFPNKTAWKEPSR